MLDTSTFVAIGDGLPAGMGDFTLSAARQRLSFAAHLARQMGTAYGQRLFQAPGIGNVPGFPPLPVRIPAAMQTTVIERSPESGEDLSDFTVPGLGIAEIFTRRPRAPLVWRDDATQSTLNMLLGLPVLTGGEPEPPATIVERVVRRAPTVALIALGFDEALEAAVSRRLERLPSPDSVRTSYERLLEAVSGMGARAIVLTVPDPLVTAHFSKLDAAASILRTPPGLLEALYGLDVRTRISVPGLVEIGNQLLRREVGVLSPHAVIDDDIAQAISSRIAEINGELEAAAISRGAWVFDLHAWLTCFERRAIAVGERTVTGRYLGGFYSLSGYYPGPTGHALIANALLEFLNAAFDASFPLVDVAQVAAVDSLVRCELGHGALWSAVDLSRPGASPRAEDPADPPADPPPLATGDPLMGGADMTSGRLSLPPGLVQTLPLCTESSYFGEAIRAVDCGSPQESAFGACAGLLFGGLIVTDSHLHGRIRIRFTPPVSDVTHFEVTLPEGLTGDASSLVAPTLYEMPFIGNRLMDYPGILSAGDLNLDTGEVTNLSCSFAIATSGLAALAAVNPAFPRQAITFPGQYGSAWARFDQRPDGMLDFAFAGTAFLPLGAALGGHMLRLPLPFAGPSQDYASVPARGTVMHPHVVLSTRDVGVERAGAPALPENTVREYTLFTHNSSFGDHFTLNVPELGDATGRSHLIGRAEMQFGRRCGNSLPVVVSLLGPGGLMKPLEPSAITEAFPGRLSPGPLGHNEFLRFPLRTYYLGGPALLDDPFDISVGAVDLRTGHIIGDLLHRGFLSQDVFLALLRVEPRTPKSSFYFRGPARFERLEAGGTVFRLQANTIVPYPQGFKFPQPDLASAFTAGPRSRLDPFLWVQALETPAQHGASLAGGESHVVASTGDVFSYAFAFDAGGPSHFEYTNETQEGCFRLHSVTWIDFARSRGSTEADTVSFCGIGCWSKGGVQSTQQAAVQISTAPGSRYVGILIDGGAVSNVNTRPLRLDQALP